MKLLTYIMVGVCLLIALSCTKKNELETIQEQNKETTSQENTLDSVTTQYRQLSSEEYDSLKNGTLSINFNNKLLDDIEIDYIELSNVSRGCIDDEERSIEFQFTDIDGNSKMKIFTPFFLPSLHNFADLYKSGSYTMATYRKIAERNGMEVEFGMTLSGNNQLSRSGNKNIILTSLHNNQKGQMEVVSEVGTYAYLDRYFVHFDIIMRCVLYRKDELSEAFAKDVLIKTSILSPLYKDKL